MKRIILMAVMICLAVGFTSQAQTNKKRIERAQTSGQVVTGSERLSKDNLKKDRESKLQDKQSQQLKAKQGKNTEENSADKARKDAFLKYNIAVKKFERAQAKVNAVKQKIEKLEQDLANERVAVAEKIVSGKGLTSEEASALEKALLAVDEKYGKKIAAARTELESAQIDMEHAKGNMENAEMEYKRFK